MNSVFTYIFRHWVTWRMRRVFFIGALLELLVKDPLKRDQVLMMVNQERHICDDPAAFAVAECMSKRVFTDAPEFVQKASNAEWIPQVVQWAQDRAIRYHPTIMRADLKAVQRLCA